jgi:hypothetical protein
MSVCLSVCLSVCVHRERESETAVIDEVELDVAPAAHQLPLLLLLCILLVLVFLLKVQGLGYR